MSTDGDIRDQIVSERHEALREDALKWRERAARDGGGIDPKAEATLALLDELERLRLVEAEPLTPASAPDVRAGGGTDG